MVARSERAWVLCLAAALAGAGLAGGCASPATLELITVARKALTDASALEKDRHAETLKRLEGLEGALDAAFDADARLAEAGKVRDAAGQPVRLTAEWVISARKGYATGRSALAEQRRRTDAEHATHLDNLSAADEALDLANRLILQQYALSERVKQIVLSLQRRLIHE